MEDIETILNTLIFDGKVEMTIIAAKEGTVGCVDGQMKLYRGVNPIIQPTGLVKTPCGLCPVNFAFWFFYLNSYICNLIYVYGVRFTFYILWCVFLSLVNKWFLILFLLLYYFFPQVFDDCHEGGEISPSNCVYMAEWLDFWLPIGCLCFSLWRKCNLMQRFDATVDIFLFILNIYSFNNISRSTLNEQEAASIWSSVMFGGIERLWFFFFLIDLYVYPWIKR